VIIPTCQWSPLQKIRFKELSLVSTQKPVAFPGLGQCLEMLNISSSVSCWPQLGGSTAEIVMLLRRCLRNRKHPSCPARWGTHSEPSSATYTAGTAEDSVRNEANACGRKPRCDNRLYAVIRKNAYCRRHKSVADEFSVPNKKI